MYVASSTQPFHYFKASSEGLLHYLNGYVLIYANFIVVSVGDSKLILTTSVQIQS